MEQKIEAPAMQLELEDPVQHPMPATIQSEARIPEPVRQQMSPLDLIAAAVQRGSSAEEIGKLMDLMDRQQNREAEQAFARAMVAFKKIVPTILKEANANFVGKNGEVDYDFATLGHICEQIIKVLAEAGISHNWKPEQPGKGDDANLIVVTCILTHELGHKDSATVKFPADPSGTKNPLQAIGSSMTYAERYSLLAACGIAVKQQVDDDAESAGKRPSSQPDERRSKDTPSTVRGRRDGQEKPAGEAPPELVKLARESAASGIVQYGKFWKNLTQKERNQLLPRHDEFQKLANSIHQA